MLAARKMRRLTRELSDDLAAMREPSKAFCVPVIRIVGQQSPAGVNFGERPRARHPARHCGRWIWCQATDELVRFGRRRARSNTYRQPVASSSAGPATSRKKYKTFWMLCGRPRWSRRNQWNRAGWNPTPFGVSNVRPVRGRQRFETKPTPWAASARKPARVRWPCRRAAPAMWLRMIQSSAA